MSPRIYRHLNICGGGGDTSSAISFLHHLVNQLTLFFFFLIISLFPLYPGAKSKAENKASLYVSSSMKYDNLCKCNIFSEGEIDFPLGCHCGVIHHFLLLPEWRGGKVLGRRSEAAPVLLSPLGLLRDPKLCFPTNQRPYEVFFFFAVIFLPHRLR